MAGCEDPDGKPGSCLEVCDGVVSDGGGCSDFGGGPFGIGGGGGIGVDGGGGC